MKNCGVPQLREILGAMEGDPSKDDPKARTSKQTEGVSEGLKVPRWNEVVEYIVEQKGSRRQKGKTGEPERFQSYLLKLSRSGRDAGERKVRGRKNSWDKSRV